MAGQIRVFIACSLDGFIAGPDDDLSWLPQPTEGDTDDGGFGAFFNEVGALLMGRNTYRIVAAFEGDWPYLDRPVLVATHHRLQPKVPTVQAVSGPIAELVEQARTAAGGRDVYVDGGVMIRQALEAGLVDRLTVTYVPVVLGSGAPLFAGMETRMKFERVATRALASGMVQIDLVPVR
jgi:dihydrofolate reductase